MTCEHLPLCLSANAYDVFMVMLCRYFGEKRQVWFLLCLLGSCKVDAIQKVHKRTLFGNSALVLVNQSFSLDCSCCQQHRGGLSCSHWSVLSSCAEMEASAHWVVQLWSRCRRVGEEPALQTTQPVAKAVRAAECLQNLWWLCVTGCQTCS